MADVHSRADTKVVVQALLERTGDELAELKSRIERDDPLKLYKLVWGRSIGVDRAQLCDHFTQNAPPTLRVRVATDIDNTLAPTRDKRYPRGAYAYPGICKLYEVLAQKDPAHPSEMLLVTARPGAGYRWNLFNRRIAKKTKAMLETLGINAPVLFGDFPHCIPRVWSEPLSRLAKRKVRNFERWMRVYPENIWFFFGDSGESDMKAGARLLRRHAGKIAAVFIHDLGNVSDKARLNYANQGVILYRNAPNAALQAYKLGFINAEDMLNVACAAIDGLCGLRDMPSHPPNRFDALMHDIDEATRAAQLSL